MAATSDLNSEPTIAGLTPGQSALWGFRSGDRGTHTSRTIMLDELSNLLDTVPGDAVRDDYAHAVVTVAVQDSIGSVRLTLMLVPMGITLEVQSATAAVDAVLRENLHGLKLDQRCVAFAALGLAEATRLLEEQAIGSASDINDGVCLNVRPFMARDLPGGKKGAGILRAKPNIHWKKDRGNEPVRDEGRFPWFWRNGEFAGERVNDVHLGIADKRTARAERGADSDA